VGTSAEVYPAAGLAGAAQQHGAMLVEINPSATGLARHADHALAAASGTALPALSDALARHHGTERHAAG